MSSHGIYELSGVVRDLIGTEMDRIHSVDLKDIAGLEQISVMTSAKADGAHFANRLEDVTFRATTANWVGYIPVWTGTFDGLVVAIRCSEVVPLRVETEPWPTSEQLNAEQGEVA